MGQRKKTNYKIIIFQTSNKIFFLFLHSWLLLSLHKYDSLISNILVYRLMLKIYMIEKWSWNAQWTKNAFEICITKGNIHQLKSLVRFAKSDGSPDIWTSPLTYAFFSWYRKKYVWVIVYDPQFINFEALEIRKKYYFNIRAL